MPYDNAGKPVMLFFPFGYLSHYLRCLMLARHFRAHFTVLFAADERYNDYIHAEGFKTFACHSFDADAALEAIRKFDFGWMNEADLEAVLLAQVAVLKALKPAVVFGDAIPTLKMAAAATGVHFISLINGYMSKFFAGTRSLSVTHPAYGLVRRLPEGLGALLTAQGEAVGFRLVHRPFKKLRARYGLPACHQYLDELEGDDTLIPDLLSLFPQRKLPAHYHPIAPLFYRPATQQEVAPALERDDRTTLVVSMGSTGNWEGVALLNDPLFQRYRIIAVGDHHRVLKAPFVEHQSFIDAESVYPQVDLVICHGGNGSIYQAISFGLPVLCVPSHFEQEWNVAAIEQEGLGKNIAGVATAKELSTIIDHWLEQRGSPALALYQRKIEQYNTRLPQTLAAVANRILSKQSSIKQATNQ